MIIAIVGTLGSGKTATLTYMALRYYASHKNIYANYGINIGNSSILKRQIISLTDINGMHQGYFMGDELWSWLDSRAAMSAINKVVSDILLKSRKRNYNLIYTCQNWHQIDVRIRNITDYICVPSLSINYKGNNYTLKQKILSPVNLKLFTEYIIVSVAVYAVGSGVLVDTFKFRLADIINCYSTNQEIKGLLLSEVDKGIKKEKEFSEYLILSYPDAIVTLIADSGHYRSDTFDVELELDHKTTIYDVCTIQERVTKNKTYFYIDLKSKKEKKYKSVASKRKAYVYFAFQYKDCFYSCNYEDVFKYNGSILQLKKHNNIKKIEK